MGIDNFIITPENDADRAILSNMEDKYLYISTTSEEVEKPRGMTSLATIRVVAYAHGELLECKEIKQ